MRNFSSGLLYSVQPEYLPELHIDDDQTGSTKQSVFSWQHDDDSMAESVSQFLKMAAKGLGLTKSDK